MRKLINERKDVGELDNETNRVKNIIPFNRELKKWVIVVLVSVLIGGMCGWKFHSYLTKEEPISTNYITAKLQDASELTTQTITYTSRVPMSDGKIPFITKKSFVMYYNATLRAGVDLSEVDVKRRGDDKLVIKLPHATVQGNPDIDPDSIEFVDEKKALLNWNKKEDVAEALAKAMEDLEKNPSIDMELLLERADEHAIELVHMLLDDAYDDYEIVVEFK